MISFSGDFRGGILYKKDQDEPFSGIIHTQYKNANIYYSAEYKNGIIDGKVIRNNKEGKMIQSEIYQNGRLTRINREPEKPGNLSVEYFVVSALIIILLVVGLLKVKIRIN